MNLFQLLRTRRKRNAIKRYIVKLGPLLARTYGKAEYYPPQRVRKALLEGEFSSEELVYALALYCTPEQFAADQAAHGATGKYWLLRAEIKEYDFRQGRDASSGWLGNTISQADTDAISGFSNIG